MKLLKKIFLGLVLFSLNLSAVEILINGVMKVNDPKIYYTSKNGFYIMSGPDVDTKGLRVKYYEGNILYSWKELKKVSFNHNKENITAKITLNDDSVKEVELVKPSSDGLHGTVEGREFNIEFYKIKNIEIN